MMPGPSPFIILAIAECMRPSKYRKDKAPAFINKLYDILSDASNREIISWTHEQNSFVILDLCRFSQEVLPRYFKHSNYHSFVRQLNMYDFNKVRYVFDGVESEHVYRNENFVEGQQSALRLIRRKETSLKCQSLIVYNKGTQQCEQEGAQHQATLSEKLRVVKENQEKLQEFCVELISQNQVLLHQNQQLAHQVKKQSKKKERILDQVFRIVGVSITQFWQEFSLDTQTLEEKTNNFEEIYRVLMSFIEQNELSKILKTLQLLIAPSEKKKPKIFKVVDPPGNFIGAYTEEQVEEFINETNILLEPKPGAAYQD